MDTTAQDKQRRALGKGLSALLPNKPVSSPTPTIQTATAPIPEPEPSGTRLSTIPISQIEPNPLQPRTVFDAARLTELANSIEVNGIIQPLLVRRKAGGYELVAGERRFRAAKIAGLTEVPAVVQDFADERILEIALIENIQREDLNPIETAQALERLARDLNMSHEDIAARTGKDRTTITNLIRLLRLPASVQLLVAERRLSMGHARAILGLPTIDLQIELAEKSAAQGLSVRQVERMVKKVNEPREPTSEPIQDPNTKAAVADLETHLGTRVRIVEKNDQRGRIEIEYFSQEELQRLYESLMSSGKS